MDGGSESDSGSESDGGVRDEDGGVQQEEETIFIEWTHRYGYSSGQITEGPATMPAIESPRRG